MNDLSALSRSTDFYFNAADNVIPIIYWLSVEAPISILSICLPSIFFLVKRGIQGGPYALLSSRERPLTSKITNHTWKLSTAHSLPSDEEANSHGRRGVGDNSLDRLNRPLDPGPSPLKSLVPTDSEESRSEDTWELPQVHLRHSDEKIRRMI